MPRGLQVRQRYEKLVLCSGWLKMLAFSKKCEMRLGYLMGQSPTWRRHVPSALFLQFLLESTSRQRLKRDGTRAETRFRLSSKRTSPFKSAGASVQWTAGSRGVRISGSNAGYTMFRGSVKSTDYPLHSPVSPSLPLPCVTVCHHVSTGL